MMANSDDYPFGGDCQCGHIVLPLMTESPQRAGGGSSLFQATVYRGNVVECVLMLSKGFACYKETEIVTFSFQLNM